MAKKAKKIPPWILLVCTGAGNVIQGGADIWVNNFLKEVWPTLPNRVRFRLLIDSNALDPYVFTNWSLPILTACFTRYGAAYLPTVVIIDGIAKANGAGI